MESNSSSSRRLQIPAILVLPLPLRRKSRVYLFIHFSILPPPPIVFHNKLPQHFCVLFKTEVYYLYLLTEGNAHLLFNAYIDSCWLSAQPCLDKLPYRNHLIVFCWRGGLERELKPWQTPSARTLIQNLSDCYWPHSHCCRCQLICAGLVGNSQGMELEESCWRRRQVHQISLGFLWLRRPAVIPLMIENNMLM